MPILPVDGACLAPHFIMEETMEHTPKIAKLAFAPDSLAHLLDCSYEDAQFVQRAVNNHAKLLEALEEIAEGTADRNHSEHCRWHRRLARDTIIEANK